MKKIYLMGAVVIILGLLIGWERFGGGIKNAGGGAVRNLGARRIPTSFPPDVPIYKGASPSGSYVSSGGNGGMIVTLQTKDDFNSVVDFYASRLANNGWQVKLAQELGGGKVFAIEKTGRIGTVTVQNGGMERMTKIGIILGDMDSAN